MAPKLVDGRRSTIAQLQAANRYREKNKDILRAKARERMARRRARLADNSEEKSQYRERARSASARHRVKNAGRLASRQADRRALAYIKENGVESWLQSKHPPPPRRKLVGSGSGDNDSSSESTSSSSSSEDEGEGTSAPAQPMKKRQPVKKRGVRKKGAQMSYEEEMNYFLDHHDPTTAADYVPQPGQTQFFQRGKWRWY
ncbi:hypothetical protein R3P38DRAFT_3168889 [Favolaschia claudopus]|uniref:Uncharacterized protein n=1 Tax=Favolaschia claudopus TaxID=2862362 RepID=A0AAW0DWY5_9AGAR